MTPIGKNALIFLGGVLFGTAGVRMLTLRKLSTAMMKRIHRNYRAIISINSGLIVLGVTGFVQPTATAMLHNASTLGIGLLSTKKLLTV